MMTIVDDQTAVYRRHADELIRYATVLVGPADAPDVVTDAVLAAFRSPAWASVGNHRAYLYRAVLNTAHSWRRSSQRRRGREERAAVRDAVHATVQAQEPSVDAHRALATLSPQQRAVVFLTYWEDLTPSQIAELLDVGEGSVRKQLARARETLRSVLS